MKKLKNPRSVALTILFSAIIFCILAITMVIVGIITYLLIRIGAVGSRTIMYPIAIFALASILTGTAVATIMSVFPLKPVNKLINGMNQLAGGNYETRLDWGNHSIGKEISSSFNLLASELQNTEMLRSDFVNNFSHEFKTPIVSIRGFAKLLQKGNLSDEQKEYLEIIVDESDRLADMATNVLNLTKVENQSIVTDITRFNLSEQVRNCILLLEKKWALKALKIIADFDEHYINANEELLKQVWINILDNSVKFSPEGSEVYVSIAKTPERTVVSIKNNGPEINAENQKRIFNKYWQEDTSHSSEGTGIGLSIAKRITELHKGHIYVTSSPEETTFFVELPWYNIDKY